MLLSLVLLYNSFVTVIVDRKETKSNLSKNQINKWLTDYYKASKTKEKKVKLTESN